MKHHKNQRGVAFVLELVLFMALVGTFVFVAARVYNAKISNKPLAQEATETVTPPPPPPKPVDPTEGWKKYVSAVGKYSLLHPPKWAEKVCPIDSSDLVLSLGPTKASSVICNSDHGAQITLVSTPAVPTASEQTLGSNVGPVVNTKATVSGVKGFRLSAVTKSAEFGLAAGTRIIRYYFLAPGRSYIILYVQTPSGDYTANHVKEFDLMVTKTLKFTK